jgi:hypothetical protein
MGEMGREAQKSSSRQSLGRAMEQLRERLRRQNPSDRTARDAEQSFERAAGGLRPMPSPGDQGQGDGQGESGQAEGSSGSPGQGMATGEEQPGGGEQAGAAMSAGAQGAGAEAAGADGVGHEAGGDPLGPRSANGATRGQTREARVRNGAGPSRAEVIEAGAKKGFARTEYQRVFEDYSAAVEEALDTTAVPAPRRYLVRRYFELIRPRVESGRKGGPSGER